jgi:acetyl-CoA acetyltransferase family protein
LEAINIAARMIESGHGDVMIAGGVESMSRAPFVMPKSPNAFDRACEIHDTTIGWRFVNPRLDALHPTISMGQTAENVARRMSISREDQDAFALESQHRWKSAFDAGRFSDEVLPVEVPQRRGDPVIVDRDEHPRPETTLEKLASLRTVFADDADATVTAGNSSGINDGAAAVLLVEESMAKALGLPVLAFVGPSATAGVEPAVMGLGPVAATRKVLSRSGRSLEDIEAIELNEAFAAQSLACMRELHLDPALVNPNGGAIAIGHPLGCSGARLVVGLAHDMVRRDLQHSLASLCVGVGQGVATLIDRS